MTISVSTLSNITARVKIQGAVGANTIALATSLLGSNEVIDGVPTVNIIGVQWTGAAGGVITISRGGVNVITLSANSPGTLTNINDSWYDNFNNTSDIVVTTSVAECQCWLTLKKLSGYQTKIEPDQFGPYDNTTVIGS